MILDVRLKSLIAVLVLALPAVAPSATIDMVPVGNLGNTDDVTGYGAVSYGYSIGMYEVTAGQYTEFLNAVAATDTRRLYNTAMWSSDHGCKIQRTGSPGSYEYSVAPDRASRPVNYVSFWSAARFANWMHNGQGSGNIDSGAYRNVGDQATFSRNSYAIFFIPTEDEWYKAAYHKNDGNTGNYFEYPTSSDVLPSNVLVDPVDPGNNATFNKPGSGYTIDDPFYRTVVGAHENSGSPYGTFDQGGNVREWNEAAVGSYRGFRGGSYSVIGEELKASYRNNNNPTGVYSDIGFRIATISMVPEPGSIVLLAGLGVMGLLWGVRRRR